MHYNRRTFIKKAAGAAASLALVAPLAGTSCTPSGGASGRPYGIQLWTVKNDMLQDPKGVLKKLASYGYTQIETFEGEKGLWWGMTPAEFKAYHDTLGLKVVSGHCDIRTNFEQKASEAAEIGLDYLVCPYVGPQETIDDFKRLADTFNQMGETCKKAGLRFAYHNHDYSFNALDGEVPQDVLMEATDSELVDYEMDIYWVVTAGADPIAWLKKYPGRFTLSHVKDRMKNTEDKLASCDLGTGTIDFPTILKEASTLGMKYYIVEQERYDDSTPMASAEVDAKYMSALSY